MITRTAILGGLGVALGAFGAHKLEPTLHALGTSALWETAVLYHLLHATACLALGIWMRSDAAAGHSRVLRVADVSWTVGVLMFSGSLYAIALGAPTMWLWPVTPLGGLCLLVGWACVGVGGRSLKGARKADDAHSR